MNSTGGYDKAKYKEANPYHIQNEIVGYNNVVQSITMLLSAFMISVAVILSNNNRSRDD